MNCDCEYWNSLQELFWWKCAILMMAFWNWLFLEVIRYRTVSIYCICLNDGVVCGEWIGYDVKRVRWWLNWLGVLLMWFILLYWAVCMQVMLKLYVWKGTVAAWLSLMCWIILRDDCLWEEFVLLKKWFWFFTASTGFAANYTLCR
jgi:hypothetical protein